MNWPKISIVTPSYNQGKYIEQTILSVINQNYPNLEYIVIDGGSTDETISIIRKYEKFISYWVSEKDDGQSHAINKGLEKCTGDIFNWLNSDDWYEPDALYIVAKEFMKDDSVLFVSGYENHVFENGEKVVHNGTYLNDDLLETIERCELTQPSTFFKLSSIRKIGGVSNQLHYIMDGEMWVRLMLIYGQKGFIKLDKVLVNFRLHENSKTVSNLIVNNFRFERAGIITSLLEFVGLPNHFKEFYIKHTYHSLENLVLENNWMCNNEITTKKKIKIYFIKKYISLQFSLNRKVDASIGIKELIKNHQYDLFLLKALCKLLF